MTGKEDHRVEKTKASLVNAFIRLINDKSFEDISINDICTSAGVRRATFYKHYRDKYEFFSEFVGFFHEKYDSKPNIPSHIDAAIDYYISYVQKIVENVYQNEKIVNNLIQSNQIHIIIGIITEKSFRSIGERLKTSVENGMILPVSVETATSMIVGGVSMAIVQWILADRNRDVGILTQEIAYLVKKCLSI